MSQQVYENQLNTENSEENLKNKPKVLKNTANSRFMILALVLGAVSLIASVSALVAAIVLVNNLEGKVTKLETQNKALESTNIEQSSLFNNLQDMLTKTESEVATLKLQNKALESTNIKQSSLFNNSQDILTKTESKVAKLELQNKALESTNNELSSLLNNLQEKLLNGKYEYSWRLRFS